MTMGPLTEAGLKIKEILLSYLWGKVQNRRVLGVGSGWSRVQSPSFTVPRKFSLDAIKRWRGGCAALRPAPFYADAPSRARRQRSYGGGGGGRGSRENKGSTGGLGQNHAVLVSVNV